MIKQIKFPENTTSTHIIHNIDGFYRRFSRDRSQWLSHYSFVRTCVPVISSSDRLSVVHFLPNCLFLRLLPSPLVISLYSRWIARTIFSFISWSPWFLLLIWHFLIFMRKARLSLFRFHFLFFSICPSNLLHFLLGLHSCSISYPLLNSILFWCQRVNVVKISFILKFLIFLSKFFTFQLMLLIFFFSLSQVQFRDIQLVSFPTIWNVTDFKFVSINFCSLSIYVGMLSSDAPDYFLEFKF